MVFLVVLSSTDSLTVVVHLDISIHHNSLSANNKRKVNIFLWIILSFTLFFLVKNIKKRVSAKLTPSILLYGVDENYIMPPIPPIPGAPAGIGFSSFLSTITHSVVRNMPAMEAAFSRATRVTLVGSIIPLSRRFS